MHSMEEGHLERIRRAELESVREHFPPDTRVLEIGGGSGFQAAMLSSWGCDVVSIDLTGRKTAHANHFPVQDYDGKNIPFPDQSFDLVFSSNVLEHVQSLAVLLKEMKRVLKPDGTLVHILPSSTWRLWTSLTHYIYAIRWLFGIQPRVPGAVEPVPIREVAERNGVTSVIKQLALAGAHGEYPNAASEVYYFSKRHWRHIFEQNGFLVVRVQECHLFHTGHAVLPGLSVESRKRIAAWLGSSCYAFVLKVFHN